MSRPTNGVHASPNPVTFPWVRTILAAVLAVALFVGVAGSMLIDGLRNQVQEAVVSTANIGTTQTVPDIPVDSFEGRPVNIFIVGIDSRFGDNGDIGVGTTEDFESILNDTNMVLHLSADRQYATVVSIPRDLMTTMAQCETADGDIVGGYYAQFNWSFGEPATGGDDDIAAGIACSTATAEVLTGLTMDGFAIIDFVGFRGLVETLGGLKICLDESVEDPEAGLRYTEAGCQTLPPDQALAYSRARKSIGDGSDIGRIGRQHQVVSAMVSQVLDTNLLTDFFSLHAFVQEALSTMSVSPSLGSLNANMGLLSSVQNVPEGNFRFVTQPWATDPYDPNRVVSLEPLASELWASLKNDAPLPPGLPYRTLQDQYFIVGPEGEPIPAEMTETGEVVELTPEVEEADSQ